MEVILQMKHDGADFETDKGFEEAQVAPLSFIDPLISLRPTFYKTYIKRIIDVLIVLISAPITVPVTFLLALLIRRDGGPAFFAQERIGKDGNSFVCWKLRSMVPDADAELEKYLIQNSDARLEWDEFQKLRQDPRITSIGKFIRRSSLDEFPQLWCVFKGDMSIVGPRPFLPQQQELYSGQLYYQMRPGITGLWQVTDHNDTNFASRVAYDDDYGKSLSFWTDIHIMFKTVFVMLRGGGL